LLLRKAAIVAATAVIVVGAGARDARSQGMWIVMTYEPSIAVGDAGDFVDDPGWYGVGLEWRSFKGNRVAWSLSASWHNMYKTTRELIQLENTTIGGTQVRFLDFVPLLVGAKYHFLSRQYRVRPYVGMSGGAYWVNQRMEIGTVNLVINSNWHFGLAPEVGITFLTPDLDLYGFISSDFNYVFSRDDSIDYTYVTVSLGIVYLL
jgi:hypothetical protein